MGCKRNGSHDPSRPDHPLSLMSLVNPQRARARCVKGGNYEGIEWLAANWIVASIVWMIGGTHWLHESDANARGT
jgi:hypothetical protein